jgi:hypothetical protein
MCPFSYSFHPLESYTNFPDVERAAQLKAKEVKKSLTPFDAVNKRKKKQNEKEQHEKDDAMVKWIPAIPISKVLCRVCPLAQSGADMAAQGGKIGRASHQA